MREVVLACPSGSKQVAELSPQAGKVHSSAIARPAKIVSFGKPARKPESIDLCTYVAEVGSIVKAWPR